MKQIKCIELVVESEHESETICKHVPSRGRP